MNSLLSWINIGIFLVATIYTIARYRKNRNFVVHLLIITSFLLRGLSHYISILINCQILNINDHSVFKLLSRYSNYKKVLEILLTAFLFVVTVYIYKKTARQKSSTLTSIPNNKNEE
jgi:hypothetical protein